MAMLSSSGKNREFTQERIGDTNWLASARHMQNESEGTRKTGRHEELGDFSTTSRTISISALAMGIGALCAFVALALLRLIGLFTNLFYFGRCSSAMVTPVTNAQGFYSVLAPIRGALSTADMPGSDSERG